MSRKERIRHQLSQNFLPAFLSVEDESYQHHVAEGAQTHFKVIIVSPHFNELTRIARHKLVNHLLSPEFEQGLHALSMHLYTPKEWEVCGTTILKSPTCKDGYQN